MNLIYDNQKYVLVAVIDKKLIRLIMKFIIIPFLLSLATGMGNRGCSASSDSGSILFTFDDLTYQTWAVSEDERGTDVIIYLVDVDPEVSFLTMTFRGIEVPVSVERKDDKIILRARLITGETVLDNYEYKVTKEKDNLKYTYRSEEYRYPVKNIRRLPTKIK